MFTAVSSQWSSGSKCLNRVAWPCNGLPLDIKREPHEVREIIQQLGALATLTEDPGSVPNTHNCLYVTPAPGDLTPSSGFCRHEASTWYTDMHIGKDYTHRTQTKPLKRKRNNHCSLSEYLQIFRVNRGFWKYQNISGHSQKQVIHFRWLFGKPQRNLTPPWQALSRF